MKDTTLNYDPKAPKARANLSVNRDLLRAAKSLDINLSATLEQTLNQIIKQAQAKRWRENNRDAIKEYNKHVAKHGLFSDGIRRF